MSRRGDPFAGNELWPKSEREKRFDTDPKAFLLEYIRESDTIGRQLSYTYLGWDGVKYGGFVHWYVRDLDSRQYELRWLDGRPHVFFTDKLYNPKTRQHDPVPEGMVIDWTNNTLRLAS